MARHREAPATTPEARERQMVSYAVDLAEKQLREGTASAQVITHYLKLATSREQLEQERLSAQIALDQAKIESIQAAKNMEKAYLEAIEAMRRYSPGTSSGEDLEP